MNSQFTAKPPLPAWKGSYGGLKNHAGRLLRSFGWILWQTIIPFNYRPEEPQTLPESTGEIEDAQIDLCQAIFDQAETRRTHLEQKAQWTFALIVFLVPLLASIFIFLFRDAPADTTGRILAVAFVFISGGLLLLGFISVVRAISVQARETLFLPALIDPQTGQFRSYSKSFQARGLLYCAAMNTAMNDHIAQFVRGAHILTAGAVITLLAAAVPAGIAFSNHASSPARTTVVGAVNMTSPQLEVLSDQIARLNDALLKRTEDTSARDQIHILEDRLLKIENELSSIKKAISSVPADKSPSNPKGP
jgi:hypothetical protein